MNRVEGKILQLLTGKQNLSDVSVEELKSIAQKQPYFSIVQLLLTKKMKQINHPEFQQQLHTTSLYFPNSHWLHYHLNQSDDSISSNERIEEEKVNRESPIATINPKEAQTILTPGTDQVEKDISTNEDDTVEDDQKHEEIEDHERLGESTINPKETQTILTPDTDQVEKDISSNDDTVEDDQKHEGIEDDERLAEASINPKEEQTILTPDPDQVEKDISTNDDDTVEDDQKHEWIEDDERLAEATINPKEAQTISTPYDGDEIKNNEKAKADASSEDLNISEGASQPSVLTTINPREAQIIETPNAVNLTGSADKNDEEEQARIRLEKYLSAQAEAFKKEPDENESLNIAEPYHTIDYFASQGIKLDPKLPPSDQLERKMRKFTDWLKHMKKGGNQPLDLGTSAESENAVKNLALDSNQPKEVVTEAMADVLIKQGKLDKAIQVYIKLSFLNPDKSAYFASKIQSLKGI